MFQNNASSESGHTSRDALDEQNSSTLTVVSNHPAPELRGYDELINEMYHEPTACLPEGSNGDYLGSRLPSIDILQPLSIQLERTNVSAAAPTTSSTVRETVNDDVEQILKVIRKEFNEEDVIVIDDDIENDNEVEDNDVINVYSSAEEGEKPGNLYDQNDPEDDVGECEEDELDDEEDLDEEDEEEQEPKRQRLNYNDDESSEQTTSTAATSGAGAEGENDDLSNPQQWQPRRRLLRGRRYLRGARNVRSNVSTPNNVEDNESQAPPSNIADVPAEPITPQAQVVAAVASTLTSPSGSTMQVPEGIDPSFLAALPEEMREEVIAEHLR